MTWQNRIALTDQITDQRIVWRKIQNVVFHDPGGHHENRLGSHLVGSGAILNQFHEVSPVHDLSLGSGHIPAWDKILGTDWWATAVPALPVFHEMLGPAHQIATTFLKSSVQNLWIGPEEVGGRHHVQHLSGDEGHDLFIVPFKAIHIVGRAIPPFLCQQEALLEHVVGPAIPLFIVEAMIMLHGLNAWFCLNVLRGMHHKAEEASP